MAEALYRKYRPQIFEDVVGQEPIERTLKNAIAGDKVSHAYLLCGPRGTGKTTTARLIAKALLCEHGPTANPDGTCEDCRMIAEGTHPDVYELDAASRTGVENVREEIINRVQFAPTRGKYKIYVIDEVHMLSTAAFNALLKTLEEPPSHVVFVLCTTDPQKVPETIHSRCQRFDFRPISPEAMVSRLGAICVSEDVQFEGEALDLIAHRAEGGMRNALTSLEQIIAFENGKVTLAGAERILGSIDSNEMAEIVSAIGKRDAAACFTWVANAVDAGTDLAQFTRDLAEHVRNMYLMTMAGDDIELDVSETMRQELAQERQMFGEDRLARMLCVLGDLSAELKASSNRRLSFEIALTRLVRPDSDLTIAGLAERVERLEKQLAGGGFAASVPAAAAASAAPAATAPSAPATGGAPAPAAVHAPASSGTSAAAAAPQREELTPAQIKLQELQRERIYKKEEQRAAKWRQAPSAPAGAPAPQAKAPATQPAAAPASQPEVSQPAAPAAAPAPVAAPAAAPAPAASHASSAPVAATAPQAAAGALSASLAQTLKNPAALQRLWQQALGAVKKQKTAYGVLFMGTRAVFDEGAGGLAIEFPSENDFAFKAVQRAEVRDCVAASLAAAAGQAVPFEFTQAASAQPASQVAATAPAVPAPAAPVPARSVAPQPAAPVAAPAAPAAAQPSAAPAQPASAPAQPAPKPAATANSDTAARPAPQPSFEAPSYDEDDVVPYDDASYSAPYDEVPYDVPYGTPEPPDAAPAGEGAPSAPAASAAQASQGAAPDASQQGIAPESAPSQAADAAPEDLQAMLQAGFGGGVVFEEVQ